MKNSRIFNYAPGHGVYGEGEMRLPNYGTSINGVALTIHGGGWNALDRHSFDGVADALAANGYAVFNINYRLAQDAPFPACVDDCMAAANFLLNFADPNLAALPRSKIFVIGASSGGHLALMTGLGLPADRVRGIGVISGIGDLVPDCDFAPRRYVTLFGKMVTPSELDAASPLLRLRADSPPIFWSHYVNDDTVPIASAENFLAAAQRCRVKTDVYFYDEKREHQHHAIWIPGSVPHRLYPDIEDRLLDFMRRR